VDGASGGMSSVHRKNMQRRRKRVELTIESHERVVVKKSTTKSSLRCPVCGVLMITPEEAALVAPDGVTHFEEKVCGKEQAKA